MSLIAQKYIIQKLIGLQGEVDFIVRDVHNPLSINDKKVGR